MSSENRSSGNHDVLIVGSGFGGACVAWKLCRAGFSVLLLERGAPAKRDDLDWNPRALLIEHRYQSRSPVYIKQYNDSDFRETFPSEAYGGMSVFYGGVSLRLRETDFENWPITYAELEPYYSEAETLLEVSGDPKADPFDPPRSSDYPYAGIPLNAPAQRVFDAAGKLGLRPFKVPVAINYHNPARPVCVQCTTCDGFPCKIEAKNDLTMTILASAQETGRLEVITGVAVDRLLEENGRITGVDAVKLGGGARVQYRSATVVISAGALQSPAILLRSGFDRFEHGRFIGRYLMRHCNAVVGYVFPFKTNSENVFHKQVCVTDFYEDFRGELGTSVGIVQDIYTPASEIVKFYAPKGFRTLAALLSQRIQNLLCIAEDEPQAENRVMLSEKTDPFGMRIPKAVHRYSKADYRRRNYLVSKARKIMRKAGGLASKVYEIDTFSHAVGSVRFGLDPKAAPLDTSCRFFGTENLYVVDGSFMPTSGGVNPSLTIAANALRVGDRMVRGLKPGLD